MTCATSPQPTTPTRSRPPRVERSTTGGDDLTGPSGNQASRLRDSPGGILPARPPGDRRPRPDGLGARTRTGAGARRGAGDGGVHRLGNSARWDGRPPPAGFRVPASSGGIVVDMGVHEFDQLRWLTGQEIVGLTGAASTVSFDEPVAGDPESVVL